jgi:hypothetical protein
MRIFFFAAGLLALAQLQLSTPMPPKQVVEHFCQLDAQGKQLTPDGWREIMGLLAYPNPRRQQRIFVVKDFVVSEPLISGSNADVYVDYIKVGEIDPVWEDFSPLPALKMRATFHLILTDQRPGMGRMGPRGPASTSTGWRIEGPPPEPHLTVEGAIWYMINVRNTAQNQIIKKNADMTITSLGGTQLVGK